jgi:hypothetical protein
MKKSSPKATPSPLRTGRPSPFAGRIAEELKLSTGTFVPVGALRVEAIAEASPVIQDALVTGQDVLS